MARHPDHAAGFQNFLGSFRATIDPPARPTSLLDMYLGSDLRALYQDTQARPAHYEDRQREVAELLLRGGADSSVTELEKNELFLTYLRTTEAQASLIEQNAKASGPEEIILEDGTVLVEDAEPSFEKQDFDDEIII
jgi:hypothetical protein